MYTSQAETVSTVFNVFVSFETIKFEILDKLHYKYRKSYNINYLNVYILAFAEAKFSATCLANTFLMHEITR